MEYMVAQFIPREASQTVNPLLAQGWSLYGGVVFTEGFYRCLQTLVKRPGGRPSPVTEYMLIKEIGVGGYISGQREVQSRMREGWSLYGDPLQSGTNTMAQVLVKTRPPMFPPPAGRGRTRRRQKNHQ